MASRSFSKQPQISYLRRFYAPTLSVRYTPARVTRTTSTMKTYMAIDKAEPVPGTPLTGEVILSIPLKKPLISASVNLKTEVKNGGKITLSLQTERGRIRVQEVSGKFGRSIELPSEHILGRTHLELVVEMRMLATYTTRSVRHQIRPFIRGDSRGRGSQAGIGGVTGRCG